MKPGYKQTDLGVLPEDWEINKLAPYCELVTKGTTPTSLGKAFHLSGINFIKIESLEKSGEILKDKLGYIDADTHKILNRSQLKENDILFSIAGALGRTTIINADLLPANTNQALAIIRLKKNSGLDYRYLYYFLRSEYIKGHVAAINVQAAQANLSLLNIREFDIILPPPAEQQAIADALGAADALLTAQRGLLAKKRDLKQATQQALLSGETRLPGFAEEWEEKTFGDVMTGFSSGATPYRENKHFYQGSVKWVSSGELNYNIITDTVEHISVEAMRKTNLRLLPAGTFLMAITGLEAAGTRGSCAILGTEATTNQSCMALFPGKELITEYLYHYYVLHGDALAFQYCQGTKQQSYTGTIVKRLPILLPPVDEQRAIAAILGDMDTELEALAAQVAKTQALKQGMMQDLLTGAVRLVPTAASLTHPSTVAA